MPRKSARPSQVTDRYWLFAAARKQKLVDLDPSSSSPTNVGTTPTGATSPGATSLRPAPPTFKVGDVTAGKWQLFVPQEHVDSAWETVAGLVRAGDLGPSAKVATAKPGPGGGKKNMLHVVIVYARDWRDVLDVRRLLRVLREAGCAQGWVHFKRDLETYAGAYVARGNRGVSVWNARPGAGDEISTKWTTGRAVPVTPENAAEIVATIGVSWLTAPKRRPMLLLTAVRGGVRVDGLV